MRKWWFNLVMLAAVLGLGLYAYKKPGKDAAPEYPISALTLAQVNAFSIERGENRIALEKKNNHWLLTAPLAARADDTQVNRLLDVLAVKSKEKLAATDLARFDLDQPALRLRLGEQVIAFGTNNSLTQEQYVLSGGSVYLVPDFYAMQIPDKPDRLLTHSLFAEGEKPVGIELPTLVAEQKDGKWTVTRPAGQTVAPGQELGQDDLNRWADDWRLSSSLLTQPYDGRPGIEQVRIKLADGRSLVLEVLQKEPDLVLARADEKLQFQYSTEAGKRLLDPRPEPLPEAAKSAVTPGK